MCLGIFQNSFLKIKKKYVKDANLRAMVTIQGRLVIKEIP